MKENYQQTYDIAVAILEKNPRTNLNHLILETIAKLMNDKLYSSKAVLQCWADNKKRLMSKDWLMHYCNGYDTPSYNTLINSIKQWRGDEYLIIQGEDASGSIPPDVWYHLSIAENIQIENPPTTFSCSC